MADGYMVVIESADGSFYDDPECYDLRHHAEENGKRLSRSLRPGQNVALYSYTFRDVLHEYVPPGPEDRIDDARQIGMFG